MDKRRDYEDENAMLKYEAIQMEYPDEVRREILKCLKLSGSRAGCMIDVGCGGGKSTKLFVEDFKQILGIDVSETQVKIARRNVRKSNVKFQIVCDDKLPVAANSTDLVLCVFCLHYLNVPVFLTECDRALVTGGILACLMYIPRIFTSDEGIEFADFLAPGSKWQRLFREFYINCGTDEGARETHLSRYQAIYDSLRNPTKRWLDITSVTQEYTVEKMVQYMSTVAGYSNKQYPIRERDPLHIFRVGLLDILRDGGLRAEDDTKFDLTFEFTVLIVEKTEEFGIA